MSKPVDIPKNEAIRESEDKDENPKLAKLFENEAVKDFGIALRDALNIGNDYSSLVELEYSETPEQFVEVIKRFLRRYRTIVNRNKDRYKFLRIPKEKNLVELHKLVDKYGVKLVRSALISYALVEREYPSKKGGDKNE
ncbi:hypothetical protein [Thermococcus alcaliphilus]|uniref:hypothetical protein n=1 Tax=Thermococcus alcaliphilus TaxID=139207 RepID=UPI002090DB54|nr:hypothetical protein [Thermococcus alcaliphilus]MCO6040882.1 hypothetical protein [Thermococcus alcaliphilus]